MKYTQYPLSHCFLSCHVSIFRAGDRNDEQDFSSPHNYISSTTGGQWRWETHSLLPSHCILSFSRSLLSARRWWWSMGLHHFEYDWFLHSIKKYTRNYIYHHYHTPCRDRARIYFLFLIGMMSRAYRYHDCRAGCPQFSLCTFKRKDLITVTLLQLLIELSTTIVTFENGKLSTASLLLFWIKSSIIHLRSLPCESVYRHPSLSPVTNFRTATCTEDFPKKHKSVEAIKYVKKCTLSTMLEAEWLFAALLDQGPVQRSLRYFARTVCNRNRHQPNATRSQKKARIVTWRILLAVGKEALKYHLLDKLHMQSSGAWLCASW